MKLLAEMGLFAYPICSLAVVIACIALKKTYDMFILKRIHHRRSEEHILNSILLIATIMVVIGFTATATGFSSMMKIVLTATQIDPKVVTKGIAVSLLPLIVSLLAFSLSSIIWFVLKSRFINLIEKTDH